MRYARQTILPEIGDEGQGKLGAATVLILGVGGLGSVCAELLTRAGIGKIILMDHDAVSMSNLQRQTLFQEKDIGSNKAEIAKKRLKKINSDIEVIALNSFLNKDTIKLFEQEKYGFDIAVDCTDNFFTRFLLNDYCRKYNIPFVFGSAVGTKGMIMLIDEDTPCFNCIFAKKVSFDNCEQVGILNTNNHIVASMQATQVMKELLSVVEEPKLLLYDAWDQSIEHVKVKKRRTCEVCNKKYNYLNGNNQYVLAKCKSRDVYAADLGRELDKKMLKKMSVEQNEDSVLITDEGIHLQIYFHGRIEFFTKNLEKIDRFMKKFLEKT